MIKSIMLSVVSCFAFASIAHADLPCQSSEEGGNAFTKSTLTIQLPSELDEISGMALSRTNPDYLWAHVDSDGKPELYVLDKSGNLVHTYTIEGVKNTDWEDIAVGPCARLSPKTCIYIGDTGDNRSKRTNKKIIMLEEPTLSKELSPNAQPVPLRVKAVFPVIYPDTNETELKFSNPDCESLMVHPTTAEIYVVSKQTGGAAATLYRVPRKGEDARLEKLATHVFKGGLGNLFPLYNAVTAADFAPDGKRFAIRTYAMVYEFDLEVYPDVAQAFAHPRSQFESVEIQGESVAYDSDGVSLITSGERFTGAHATMSQFECNRPKE